MYVPGRSFWNEQGGLYVTFCSWRACRGLLCDKDKGDAEMQRLSTWARVRTVAMSTHSQGCFGKASC